ncbi:site-specific integrase [Nodularia sp. UHCC 0506]|uniref:tyrosine-type recombinase/integrase n=1 Tax=Nodularia sp. UHCC 0506 TaxID=3110243 RepID=UPI002B203491|nr:site-specific integrase [Nodularia sp. UHCC 0506]MEA5515528.1 site-specific integrase [Nodularia sp. UHCC 0506]
MKNNRHGKATIFSSFDYEKIINCTVGENHKMIFRLAYYTGARMGEVCKLLTLSVYGSGGEVLDCVTYQKYSTKTKETRQVPISHRLREYLKFYWHQHHPNYQGYLFPGTGEGHLQFQSADDAFRRAVKSAGLEGMGYSTHSFRRTAATNLATSGIGLAVIQRITGHSTLTSLQRYIDVAPVQIQSAIAIL